MLGLGAVMNQCGWGKGMKGMGGLGWDWGRSVGVVARVPIGARTRLILCLWATGAAPCRLLYTKKNKTKNTVNSVKQERGKCRY